jgi:hypothetical protein
VPVFEDQSLPHQIVQRLLPASHYIAVSCNCLGRKIIEARRCWGDGEALACWREYHKGEGEAHG